MLLGAKFIYAQNGYSVIKGTHVIVAACKDGIIVGSDSRMSYYAKQPKGDQIPDAYFDGMPKIYPAKDFVFTISKLVSVRDTTFEYYFNEFSMQIPDTAPLLSRIQSWYDFISSKPKKIFDEFRKIRIIAAKFDNNLPNICAYWGETITKCDLPFAETDSSGFEGCYSQEDSCEDVRNTVESWIRKMSKKHPYQVGGDISVLYITPRNQFMWLKNEPVYHFQTVRQIWKAYKSGRFKVTFTSPEAEKRIKGYLKTLH
jgi:hypothetical protein